MVNTRPTGQDSIADEMAACHQFERARALAQSGQALQAELLCIELLKRFPGHPDASMQVAELALRRGDAGRAAAFLEQAVRISGWTASLGLNLAVAHMNLGQTAQAAASLEATVANAPESAVAWLMLGQVREEEGKSAAALRAQFNAVTRAQRRGHWVDESSTPAQLLPAVLHAIDRVRRGRRELLRGIVDEVRQAHGQASMTRVDHALSGYLRDWDSTPSDPRQRPKFFFFPDLPNTAYHDPYLQPWARQLQTAFPEIREEAIRIVEEDRRLPNFIPDNLRVEDFVSGAGSAPSWEAFFFYRHGERYDANHARCPRTSAVLESIDLCRIEDQAPEILFSVLKPGSHINAHHGVTNVRLVMHLPLVVPSACALNLVDRGEHHWREGQLVMFDDTYLHEAWNRSEMTRIVLLMDSWNPHLTNPERVAVRQIIETITAIQLADRAARAASESE